MIANIAMHHSDPRAPVSSSVDGPLSLPSNFFVLFGFLLVLVKILKIFSRAEPPQLYYCAADENGIERLLQQCSILKAMYYTN